ncbi:hypothetical protein [Burkholderia sp. 3C]
MEKSPADWVPPAQGSRHAVSGYWAFFIVALQALMILIAADIAYWLVSCSEASILERLGWAAFFTAILVPIAFMQLQPDAGLYCIAGLVAIGVLAHWRRWIPARWLVLGVLMGGGLGVVFTRVFVWNAACRLW